MTYPRVGRLSLWIVAGLIILSGCAATPAQETSEVADTVFDYAPASAKEGTQQAALEIADAASRLKADAAKEELDWALLRIKAAKGKLRNAQERAAAGRQPPEDGVPTEEEMKALVTDARTKRMAQELAVIEMVDRYEAFLTEYPDNWHVRHRYAWFLADNYMHYESAEEWRRVIEDEPRFPYAYNNLGTLYNHMGRDKEAIVLFHKAISLYPDDPTFHVNLAVNYFTHRKETEELYGWELPRIFEECVAEYRKALALAPTDKQIAFDLATQYVMAKYFNVTDTADRALADWQYYLTLDLDDNQRGIAYRSIGTIYLRQKKDYPEALVWMEKAHALLNDATTETLVEEAREAATGNASDEQTAP